MSIQEPMRFLYERGFRGNGIAMGRKQFAILLKEYTSLQIIKNKPKKNKRTPLDRKPTISEAQLLVTNTKLSKENSELKDSIRRIKNMCNETLRIIK